MGKVLFIIGLLAVLILAGCQKQDGVFFDSDRCPRTPGTYCHVFRVQNGTVDINFSSVQNGTFVYQVEG